MKSVRKLCVALLIVTAIASFIGGYMLINDPSGRSMQLNYLYDLYGTPFKDFTWPGLLLIIIIGVGCVIAASVTMLRNKKYPVFIITEGVLILLWVLADAYVFKQITVLQTIFGLFGIALILFGNLIRKYLRNEVHHPINSDLTATEQSHHRSHKHKKW